MKVQQAADPQGIPIQVVSRRTGLSTDVIRAWERRYNAVSPARTGSGRRLYGEKDVEKLLLLKGALAGGRRIGDVANLSVEELQELVREDQSHRLVPVPGRDGEGAWKECL